MFTLNSEPSDLPNRQLASATTLRDLLIVALGNPLLTDGDLADIANAADSQAWKRSELNPMRDAIEKTVAALDLQSRIIPIQLDQNYCDLLSYSVTSWLRSASRRISSPSRHPLPPRTMPPRR